MDYLVKPVDKVELGNLLEKIAQQLQEKVEQSQTLSQELDETGFTNYLSGKRHWWIGLSKEKQGSFTIPYYVLGQDWQIFISDQPLDGIVVTPLKHLTSSPLRIGRSTLKKPSSTVQLI